MYFFILFRGKKQKLTTSIYFGPTIREKLCICIAYNLTFYSSIYLIKYFLLRILNLQKKRLVHSNLVAPTTKHHQSTTIDYQRVLLFKHICYVSRVIYVTRQLDSFYTHIIQTRRSSSEYTELVETFNANQNSAVLTKFFKSKHYIANISEISIIDRYIMLSSTFH